jgi:septation ring formation regulator EzrA
MSKAARVAGVSKTTMHKWIKSGKLSASKDDTGAYSIDESELLRVTSVRKRVTSPPVNLNDKSVNLSEDKAPLNLSIYASNTLNEAKYAAELEAVNHERNLLRQQVKELRDRAEAAEQRSEAAAERYHDSIKTMTRLLEDKREAPKRRKFLGIF